MPKDKDEPEKPYIPSSFEAERLAGAMGEMFGSMMGHIKGLGVDVEGMAAMVPLSSGMQALRKKKGASYKDVATALKVRQMDIKAIEAGSPPEVNGEILVAYAEWLGISDDLAKWIANHPQHAAKMGLGGKDAKAQAPASNVIPFQLDPSAAEDTPNPTEPGEVLPISPAKPKTGFGGLDLISKLISGDPELMASLESEFSKIDDADTEMFGTADIDELTANPALPATCEFEITLRDVKPRIWRRFRVSNELTLQQFHQVIQAVMGWRDTGSHSFDIFGAWIEGESRLADMFDDEDKELAGSVHNTREYQICDFNLQEKDEIDYDYDHRSGWDHKIVLKKILPADSAAAPVCLKGKRACPPEGCPGGHTYQEALEARANNELPMREEWSRWADRLPADPEKFDLNEVNEQLAELPDLWKAEREERANGKEDV